VTEGNGHAVTDEDSGRASPSPRPAAETCAHCAPVQRGHRPTAVGALMHVVRHSRPTASTLSLSLWVQVPRLRIIRWCSATTGAPWMIFERAQLARHREHLSSVQLSAMGRSPGSNLQVAADGLDHSSYASPAGRPHCCGPPSPALWTTTSTAANTLERQGFVARPEKDLDSKAPSAPSPPLRRGGEGFCLLSRRAPLPQRGDLHRRSRLHDGVGARGRSAGGAPDKSSSTSHSGARWDVSRARRRAVAR